MLLFPDIVNLPVVSLPGLCISTFSFEKVAVVEVNSNFILASAKVSEAAYSKAKLALELLPLIFHLLVAPTLNASEAIILLALILLAIVKSPPLVKVSLSAAPSACNAKSKLVSVANHHP